MELDVCEERLPARDSGTVGNSGNPWRRLEVSGCKIVGPMHKMREQLAPLNQGSLADEIATPEL
jgi:hypothetical protein